MGNAAPNPNNGHCIPAVGYDERNLYVVTWGALKPMSWQFYDAYADEVFAVLSNDWINAKLGVAPSGFNLAALNQDLAANHCRPSGSSSPSLSCLAVESRAATSWPLDYSSRSVLAGSILAIFTVGRVVASNVTNTSVRTTVARVGAS